MNLIVGQLDNVSCSRVVYLYSRRAGAYVCDKPVVVNRLQLAFSHEPSRDRPQPNAEVQTALELGLVQCGAQRPG
jgi:hypothetical protein